MRFALIICFSSIILIINAKTIYSLKDDELHTTHDINTENVIILMRAAAVNLKFEKKNYYFFL